MESCCNDSMESETLPALCHVRILHFKADLDHKISDQLFLRENQHNFLFPDAFCPVFD